MLTTHAATTVAPMVSCGAATSESFEDFFARVRRLPVFVVLGVQGSGTNLLRRLLVQAFGFCVVQDQAIVFSAASRLGEAARAEDVRRQFGRVSARLQPSMVTRKTTKIVKSNADYRGIRDQFDAVRIRSAADLAQFVYAYGAFSLNTSRMAVKSDDLWEHIEAIDSVIPNRRIVLLTRDFRDNLLSITNKDFGPVEPLVAARYVHDRFVPYEREFDRTPAPHRFHVRYEDLLRAPQDFVRRFSQHFDLPLVPDGQAAVERLPIRRTNVAKWAALDPNTLAQCQGILRAELLRYGYGLDCDASEPGAGSWALARGRDVLRRVPQKLRRISKRLRN